MAFQPISHNAIDLKRKEKGHVLTGVYSGCRKINTQFGEQTVYNFTDEDGYKFGVYGFTLLNYAMGDVGEGTLCRITYQGTAKTSKKYPAKDVHQVLVEVDVPEGGEKGTGIPF